MGRPPRPGRRRSTTSGATSRRSSAEVRALIAAGGAIEEAPAKVAQQERDKWRLFDEFHARNVTAAFAELEWE